MKTSISLAIAIFLFSVTASAFTPRTGHWYDSTQDGTGYNIDIQDGAIVVTVYSYKANGDAQWYIATGAMTGGQQSFTGTLNKIKNGACISCPYVKPITDGNDGTITINFLTEISATVTRPGGLVSNIKPLNFGFGDPPTGLLGQWVYVYDIVSTFADRYTFTTIGAATSGGNGVALDLTKLAGCELQTSGALAGKVICAHVDSTGTVLDGYMYGLALDGTWGGVWVSPTAGSQYDMDGFLVKSRSGYSKAMALLPSALSLDDRKAAESQLRASAISAKSAMATDQRAAFETAIAAIRNVLIEAH